MKKIHVLFFASLREQTNIDKETLQTEGLTPADVYQELKQRYGFIHELSELKVAISDSFAPMDTHLKDGDTIVFIPPVAGG